jgi:hypothetical protein
LLLPGGEKDGVTCDCDCVFSTTSRQGRMRRFVSRERFEGAITIFIREVEIQLVLFQNLLIRVNKAIFYQDLIQRLGSRRNRHLRSRLEITRTHHWFELKTWGEDLSEVCKEHRVWYREQL